MGSSRLLIFFILPILLVLDPLAPAIADDGVCTKTADYCWSCSNTNNTFNNGSIYKQNLNTLFSSFLSDTQINSKFYNLSMGQAPDKVNAIAVCRGDVGLKDCHTCFKDSVSILLQNCTNQKEAIIWAQRCTVRYSNISIFGVLEDEPVKFVPSPHTVPNAEQYKQVLNPLFENLSEKAAAGDSVSKFAAGHALVPATNQTIYATVQCSPDLDKQNCSECLKESISDIPKCCEGLDGGRVLRPSCYLRFESNLFYECGKQADNGVCTKTADYCWSCSNTKNTFNNGSIYKQNLNTLLSSFLSNTQINSKFYNLSTGQAPDKVNAIAVCRGDVALKDCHTCFKDSVSILLQNCTNQKEAIIWAQRCTVRYSNISIFGVLEDEPVKFVPSPHTVPNAEQYKQVLNPLFGNLSEKAAAGDSVSKFAAGHAPVPATNQTIYATVQCSPDLDKQNCSECLKESISDIPNCFEGLDGGRVLRPSCYLRFESNRFYECGKQADDGVCTTTADYCWSCSNTKNTFNNGSIYKQNLNTLLSSFLSNTQINSTFYNLSTGQAPDKVNAIAVCRGDVALKDCHSCFKDSVSILLQNCTNQKEAIIWAQRCTVRYSNISIFGVLEDEPVKFVPSPHTVPNAEQYKQVLKPLFGNLSEKAAAGDSVSKFAAGHAPVPATNQTIYATVQCSPDLDKQNCNECLKESISDIPNCFEGLDGGRVLRPSCYLRFESNLFYESTGKQGNNTSNITTKVSPPSFF